MFAEKKTKLCGNIIRNILEKKILGEKRSKRPRKNNRECGADYEPLIFSSNEKRIAGDRE